MLRSLTPKFNSVFEEVGEVVAVAAIEESETVTTTTTTTATPLTIPAARNAAAKLVSKGCSGSGRGPSHQPRHHLQHQQTVRGIQADIDEVVLESGRKRPGELCVSKDNKKSKNKDIPSKKRKSSEGLGTDGPDRKKQKKDKDKAEEGFKSSRTTLGRRSVVRKGRH